MKASREEEFWNALTHFIGLLGSIIGICYLLFINNDLPIISLSGVLFFGFGLVSVYLSSTLYHYVSEPVLKEKLRIFDHISIYYLIAGSYAPVCLITLLDKSGIYIFIAVCIIALFGTIFKLFYTGKFEKISLGLYLVMGWLILIDIRTLFEILELNAVILLALSGLSYTIGTIFYSMEKKYAHTIWHLFVIAGSSFHFFLILYHIV
ncbi:hemolysin III family protein [Flavobacteriaceae bacterium]|jgi:hemolysin III|nr:hemolysin III family protein [Flavobacteriaceae bacterium]